MKKQIATFLIGISLSVGIASSMSAQEMARQMNGDNSANFQPIEQPLALKIAIALGGLSLIGTQLWWFLGSKPKPQKAEMRQGIQEVTITVDGGYVPSLVTLKRGQTARLNFLRRDPSSCLEKVLFPDFHIAQDLILNQTTPIEFTPDSVGVFQFSCGMGMFHGAIAVEE